MRVALLRLQLVKFMSAPSIKGLLENNRHYKANEVFFARENHSILLTCWT